MPNPHRGEIAARLDGAPYRLCLTLGALAELEHAFGDTDMLALAERFQAGRLSAREAVRIIAAGLLGATFGGGAPPGPPSPLRGGAGGGGNPDGDVRSASAEGRAAPTPFPG